MSGNISVENVEGEIDVNTMSGSITLKDVSGSVSTHTMSRDITARLNRINTNKPMSFSSFNADIDVTLPKDIKATFVINTMGGIYTDFDDSAKKTRKTITTQTNGKRSTGAKNSISPSPDPNLAKAELEYKEALEELKRTKKKKNKGKSVMYPNAALMATERFMEKMEKFRHYTTPKFHGKMGTVVEIPVNGGGPEIQFTNFNGDIFIRRSE